MVSRRNERLGGLFIATIGALLTIWTWRSAIDRGHYYLLAAMGAPAFTIIGIALIVVPGYRTERLDRGEDLDLLSGWELITARWWGILAITYGTAELNALGSGFINLAILKDWQL
ncbi:hypothetical protein [Chamaesiphon sp. VAR_69_metabat_338]|uniref:hypothetical protein n=1 Tax=Chamaesiphon sp. VAR_69_metabat_338 TaxID=2964704 RepID=UPI00286E3310|nr:hypothetical protein [Chamaesiphon sp. VAR_69_metabat_338]